MKVWMTGWIWFAVALALTGSVVVLVHEAIRRARWRRVRREAERLTRRYGDQ